MAYQPDELYVPSNAKGWWWSRVIKLIKAGPDAQGRDAVCVLCSKPLKRSSASKHVRRLHKELWDGEEAAGNGGGAANAAPVAAAAAAAPAAPAIGILPEEVPVNKFVMMILDSMMEPTMGEAPSWKKLLSTINPSCDLDDVAPDGARVTAILEEAVKRAAKAATRMMAGCLVSLTTDVWYMESDWVRSSAEEEDDEDFGCWMPWCFGGTGALATLRASFVDKQWRRQTLLLDCRYVSRPMEGEADEQADNLREMVADALEKYKIKRDNVVALEGCAAKAAAAVAVPAAAAAAVAAAPDAAAAATPAAAAAAAAAPAAAAAAAPPAAALRMPSALRQSCLPCSSFELDRVAKSLLDKDRKVMFTAVMLASRISLEFTSPEWYYDTEVVSEEKRERCRRLQHEQQKLAGSIDLGSGINNDGSSNGNSNKGNSGSSSSNGGGSSSSNGDSGNGAAAAAAGSELLEPLVPGENVTQWYTDVEAAERVVLLRAPLSAMLVGPLKYLRPTEKQWELLKIVATVLYPLALARKELEREPHVTVSHLLPLLSQMQARLEAVLTLPGEDRAAERAAAAAMLAGPVAHWTAKVPRVCSLATCLDPRTKGWHWKDNAGAAGEEEVEAHWRRLAEVLAEDTAAVFDGQRADIKHKFAAAAEKRRTAELRRLADAMEVCDASGADASGAGTGGSSSGDSGGSSSSSGGSGGGGRNSGGSSSSSSSSSGAGSNASGVSGALVFGAMPPDAKRLKLMQENGLACLLGEDQMMSTLGSAVGAAVGAAPATAAAAVPAATALRSAAAAAGAEALENDCAEELALLAKQEERELARCAEIVDKYRRLPGPADDDDPLQWWRKNEEALPGLARLAKRYLAVPASCLAASSGPNISGDGGPVERSDLQRIPRDFMPTMMLARAAVGGAIDTFLKEEAEAARVPALPAERRGSAPFY